MWATIGLVVAAVGVASASDVTVVGDAARFESFGARFTIATTCTFDNQVTATGSLSETLEACDTLTASGTVSTAATLRAGDRVILRDGFNVAAGASLTVEIDRTLYPDAYLQDDTPDGETVYAARFYLDAKELTLDPGDRFIHFVARDAAGEPLVRLVIKQEGTEVRLVLEAFEDGGGVVTTEGSIELVLPADGYHWLEVGRVAGAGDGSTYLCLDATMGSCVELTDLDNDAGSVHSVRWGAMDVRANLGTLDVDEFESQRATLIGPSPKEAP
ncbi:MAG TPA: hypothetical protein VMV46_12780 [Thermoanaerobaculia bacterium]|nr:hypothetical protein [Thermoanaerobaculia bacterium]